MTNIVGCAPDDVRIGMPVQVIFEHHDDVWLPLFEPAAAERDADEIGERKAVISGIGQSDIGRRLYRTGLDLTVDAALAAIADAGLTRDDIDGIATYPGNMDMPPGFSGAGVNELQDALRLKLNWLNGGLESPAQLGSVIAACAAVAAGYANHVLCFRTVYEGIGAGRQGPGERHHRRRAGAVAYRAGGFMQWSLPFGAPSAANWIAMYAQRHFHEYGTTREQLAQIALNGRRNAQLNPKAIYRDPMSMDDYFDARMITSPFCLFDCDVPCDGGTAVIVSRAEAAADLRKPPIRVEAIGSAIRGRPSWDQWDDLTTICLRDAAAMMWSRTDLKPADVARGRALRRVQLHHPGLAGGARVLRQGRGRAVHRGRRAHRPRRRPARRSTPTAASSRPAASTATASCTRRASSCGARAATARCPATPRWRWPVPAAVRSPGLPPASPNAIPLDRREDQVGQLVQVLGAGAVAPAAG